VIKIKKKKEIRFRIKIFKEAGKIKLQLQN
jgi:hypothetical protein